MADAASVDVLRLREIRELVVRWMTEPDEPLLSAYMHTIPASPDDVLYLLDLIEDELCERAYRETVAAEPRETLLAAAELLRREAEKDTSRSQNDRAELRIAAAVCEGLAARA